MAIKVVVSSPGSVLRNSNTIQRFKQLQKMPNQPHPLFKMFYALLENNKLNEIETVEIA